jgi:hypothetical protein
MWQCVGFCGDIRDTILIFHHPDLPPSSFSVDSNVIAM